MLTNQAIKACFITHFDNDHVDAFNEVYASRENDNIEIEQIYVTPLDYEYYIANLREWDTPESYARFLEITQNSSNIVALKRGEKFEMLGLDVEVFNAYDEMVIAYGGGDFPNNASLVFKIKGDEDSILFCGDCHDAPLARYLIECYGKDLQCEYVQTGYHGNNSFPTEFYDVVKTRLAFFDGPSWLMDSDAYTAKELMTYFKENGVECIDWSCNKNEFVFK